MNLFSGERVAVIGSTGLVDEVGMTSPHVFEAIAYNLKRYYRGKVQIIDVDRPADISADVIVSVLPPELSLEWAEHVASSGARVVIQITGGFTDQQRTEYSSILKKGGCRLLGPNSIMGIIDTSTGLNTTFHRDFMPEAGDIALISQSGGVGAAILDKMMDWGIGISSAYFMGDKADLEDYEILQMLGEDQFTRAVAIYMEGLRHGREFVEVASHVVKRKPVVVLKGGISRAGARRALSHTASVSGSDDIFDAAFKEAGVIRVSNMDELLASALTLSSQPPMKGRRIAVISNVGGPAILAADEISRSCLELARFSSSAMKRVASMYHGVEMINPVDLIADADALRFTDVIEVIAKEADVNGLLIINMMKSCFLGETDLVGIAKTLSRIDLPVVDVIPGGGDLQTGRRTMKSSRVPVLGSPELAVSALVALYNYHRVLDGTFA